ncbi:MAG TPA: DNA polymerase III subunit gamma/tau [Anaerolineaceae bacterium]|nr:DNA polymerase III subunit gamma/tau [Anaerolineaceae bacterium]
MSQALYRKWRPRLWDEVIAQEPVVETLRNAIRSERVAHAYLFAGPRGTGKTTTARLLAKAVNCLEESPDRRPCDHCDHCLAVNEGHFMDLIEIDAASNTSVEDVRELRDKINFSPSQGRYRVYIIDEVHMLSTAAFNALLKTLEEPPPHVIFILATTEVHKIPATVLSRCQRHEFRRIPVNDIVRHLTALARQEKLDVQAEALILIARQSTGSMRDAISLLDQLASSGKAIDLELAQNVLGTATNQVVVDLVGAILSRNAAEGLTQIHKALDAGTDPRQFARQVVEYLRGLLFFRMENGKEVEATPEMRAQMKQHADGFTTPQLLDTIRAFNSAATDLRGGWQPGLLLELAFAEAIEPKVETQAPTLTVAAHTQAATPQSIAQPPTETPAEIRVRTPASPPAEAPDRSAAQPPVQPARAAAQPPAVEPAPAAGAISFQALAQHWPRIRQLVKKRSPQTEALLNSGKLVGIKDGALIIGFSPVLKVKMETGNNLEITSQAIAQTTGAALNVRCVLYSGKQSGSLPADMEVDSDGIVGTALRDLGGEVVDIQ